MRSSTAMLLVLFVTVPLLELVLLTELGKVVGLGPTLALVVLTGILGATLARRQGLSVLARFREKTAQGVLPGREAAEGVLVLVAAAVLLTPGLLTDLAGFLLLVPPVRALVATRLLAWARSRVRFHQVSAPRPPTTSRPAAAEDAIDVEFRVDD